MSACVCEQGLDEAMRMKREWVNERVCVSKVLVSQ